MMKKIWTLLLAVCMVTVMMPAFAFAGDADGGAEQAKLKFSASSLEHGRVSYSVGDSSVVDVDPANAGEDGFLWTEDLISFKRQKVKIYIQPQEGYVLDYITAKEGEGEDAKPAWDGNLSDGVYSFTLDSKIYPIELGFKEATNDKPEEKPDPEKPGQDQPSEGDKRPEHFGENGYISFDTNGTDGKISYACSDDVSQLQDSDWKSVSVDGSSYSPVDMNELNEGSKVFFRIEGRNSKHLDLDRGFSVKNDQKRIYNVCGTYNDDPKYDAENEGAQPADRKGLKDMYDNMRDMYIIPIDKSTLVSESRSARFVELHWTDMISLEVAVDEASQYLIANGKTEIGIATGKGFSVSVQDGCKVSVPALQDIDLGENEERYLIDLKVNRSYFIPYISINGKSYETFDTGDGGDDFTNISVSIPAGEFRKLASASNGTVTIHLTVDKNVSVSSDDAVASYNMIDDGETPEGVSMETLDSEVELTADASELTENDISSGAARAYDITMDVNGEDATEFDVPIDITLDGNFYGNESDYNVIREHEGEDPEAIDFSIDDGRLTFSTDKFSTFTIRHNHRFSDELAHDESAHWKECICGARINEGGHSMNAAVTPATKKADGLIERSCQECSEKIDERIPRIKSISLSTSQYTYSGGIKSPKVLVKDAKGASISTANYTVTVPSGRKSVGMYRYAVNFNGNYQGKYYVYLVINPKGTSISKVSGSKKALTVKWKKQSTKMATSRITGYQIRYSTSSKMTGAKLKTVSGYKKTSRKVTGLSGKRKYYVQVRTYKTVSGVKYFSAWSSTKSVKTK